MDRLALEKLLSDDSGKINANDIWIGGQDDLLPYDANWEFPRQRLYLGD